ncbi:MAG: phosphoenolpyruvate-protein kinase (PTS system EI component) [Verrucomicrobiales bacterium]|jgi:phosphoenolpyruvate-protein kinase (PTS system EI component)
MLILKGRRLSPGLAEGAIFVHWILSAPLDVPEDIAKRDVDDEISRLDDATVKISDDLVALASRVEKEIDTK